VKTGGKKDRNALQGTDAVLSAAFEKVDHGVAITNATGEVIFLNRKFSELVPSARQEAVPFSLKKIIETHSLFLQSNEIFDPQKLFQLTDGRKKKLMLKSDLGVAVDLFISRIHSENENSHYLLEVTAASKEEDTTDSNNYEEMLLKLLLETAPFGIEIYNSTGILTQVNSAWEKTWNISAENFVNQYNILTDDVHNGSHGLILKAFSGVNSRIPAMLLSRDFRNLHSSQKWIRQTAIPMKNKSGAVKRVIVIQEDVSQQKEAEFALRFSESEFRIIWEKSPLGMRLTDENGIIRRVNPAFCDLVGKSENALLGKPLSVAYTEGQGRHILEMHKKKFHERTVATHFETEITLWNGKKLWLEVSNSFFVQVNGKTLLLGIFRDISQKKNYEIALKTEQQYFESLFQNSPEAITLTDSSGKIKRINDAFSRLFDFSEKELLGESVDDTIVPDEDRDNGKEITRKASNGEIIFTEAKRMRKNGDLIDVSILASAVDPTDKKSDLYLVYRDIREHKKTERELQTLLREKDILLKEVYHRVKNNFQVISSLLNLQAKGISDEKAKRLCRESQNRIRTMALVHEKLYQSPDLSNINLKEYFSSLIHSLYRSLQSENNSIRLSLDIDAIELSIDQAIPCGLIVNEIFTNAMKYAFPEGYSGNAEIAVTCKMTADNQIKLTIRDNGKGITENYSPMESKSLGMRLVHSLVENQLEGSIDVTNKNGTEVHILFSK